MRVRDHVLISTAGAVLAVPFIGRDALSLWAAGVLIDADHYAWFCLRHRSLSPKAAMRFFNEADPARHPATRVLHAPATVLGVMLIGLCQRRLLPAALGMAMHAALDAHYVAHMNRARSAALARDKYFCRVCGTGTPAAGTHLRHQPLLLPSYRAENLISLCRSCHEAAHTRLGGPVPWT